jgi:RNA polymerase sigma-70 factor (ECF subfamily)
MSGASRRAAVRSATDGPPTLAAERIDDERATRDRRLATLLAEAAAGHAAAFEAFYEATFGYAQALARRMLRDADLEDVLSECFLQAWRDVATFDERRGSPVTWLLTIVRSRALDALDRARRDKVVADDELPDAASDAPSGPDLLASLEAGCALREAVASLSSDERWVLGLAYYREMSHARIAEATGWPLGTVKSLILRAQHKLRERLAAHS